MSVTTQAPAVGPVALALERVGAGLDGLAALDPADLSWAEQEQLVRRLELAQRRLAGARLRALAAFATSGAWSADGQYVTTSSWLRHETQTARGDARRDLALARELAQWPAVAAALAAGEISARSAGVLCSALARLPEVNAEMTGMLLAAARLWDPAELARALAARLAAADPGTADADAVAVHVRRRLHHSATVDGLGRLDAWLEPELAELFADALDAESVADRAAGDERTSAQCRHDAFGRLIRRAVSASGAPRRHGQPVQLLVLTTPEALQGDVGAEPACTAGGHRLSRAALARLACASPLTRCLRSGSVPLELGRTVRVASAGQYKALVVRDGGCAVRGCDRPASWCTPHHVIPWQRGGATDLSNLLLLCEAHHHRLHDEDRHLPLRDGRRLSSVGTYDPNAPPRT
ncbi:MAG TPA: DUF222 domain-containing protein [Mycobacteriales bacterium]|nr:DUF222 domain-containing protein [Mycobacteriales bacterium]